LSYRKQLFTYTNISKIITIHYIYCLFHGKLEGSGLELIGLLMKEHRLIEKIGTPIETELKYILHQNKVHTSFIYDAIDFFRTYVDRFHHGKEENILFLELKKKELEPMHHQILTELEEEHKIARRTVEKIYIDIDRWRNGDNQALTSISVNLKKLIELYPGHIEKEDKHFFFPCQNYFTREEREKILQAGYNFNQEFTYINYKDRINTLLEYK